MDYWQSVQIRPLTWPEPEPKILTSPLLSVSTNLLDAKSFGDVIIQIDQARVGTVLDVPFWIKVRSMGSFGYAGIVEHEKHILNEIPPSAYRAFDVSSGLNNMQLIK